LKEVGVWKKAEGALIHGERCTVPMANAEVIMKTIYFVVYLANVSEMTETVAESLFAAGCDGVPGSREGRAMIQYAREANSMDDAVIPALDEIKKAGFDFSKVEIDPESMHELYLQSRNVA
jgi:hypothetical protein